MAALLGGGYWGWQRYSLFMAERAIAERNYRDAVKHSRLLLAYGVDKEPALEIYLRALIELSPENAYHEVMALLSERDARDYPEISRAMLSYLVQSNQFKPAHELSKKLEQSMSGDPDYQLLMANLAIKEDNVPAALERLSNASALNPTNSEARLLSGKLLLRTNNTAAKVQAKANLRAAAEQADEFGRQALFILATTPEIPLFDADRKWLIYRLREPRTSTAESRLLADNQQIILQPLGRTGVIQGAIKREGKDHPVLLVQWLIGQGAYAEMWNFLDSDVGEKLVGNGRWDAGIIAALSRDRVASQEFLNRTDKPIDALSRALMLAYLSAYAVGPGGEPTQQWQDAFELADQANAYDELNALCEIASRRQWNEAAAEAGLAAFMAIEDDQAKVTYTPKVMTVLNAAGRTQQMLDVTVEVLDVAPDYESMINNRVYLRALLGQVTEVDVEEMQEIIDAGGPNAMNSALALCYLQLGDVDKAQATYARLDPKYLSIPNCRLVGLLLAAKLGDEERAQEFQRGINVDNLLPEERSLYNNAL
ncbi:tetratricopeptide repeat protein [Cerasicoccus fimbriatus]|uniref:tetratricopeptide repeat protein n=1 Tax=Cerasicoccus fimbriatus TaxID=3014554 RepID=UPI0022B2EEE7|nr:hypothetical protein [Cerasicoccus sp. TK19100]